MSDPSGDGGPAGRPPGEQGPAAEGEPQPPAAPPTSGGPSTPKPSARPRRPSPPRPVGPASAASLVLVAVASVAATMGFSRVFGAGSLWGPVITAALVPAAVVGLLWLRRIRLAVTAVVTVAATVVASGPAVFPDTTAGWIVPTGATFHAVGDGFQNGWARLLTTSLPADPRPSLIFVAFATAALASWLGAETATRTRSSVAPAVPPVIAAAIAQAFAVSTGGWSAGSLGALVASIAALVIVRSLPQARWSRDRGVLAPLVARRLARGLPVVVGLAVVAPLLAPHLPGGHRTHPVDPREHRRVNPPPQTAVNPLAELPGRIARPEPVLFSFRSDGVPPPRIRQVVLDRYDGSQWYTSAEYEAAGHRLPPGPTLTVGRHPLTLHVRVRTLDGIWLPAPDRPTGFSGVPVAWDPVHGVAAVPKGDVQGRTYTVDASVPMPTATQIEAAGVANDPAHLALPQPVPPQLAQLGMEAVRRSASPAQRAKALQTYLRDRFRRPKSGTDVPSGHSYGNLIDLVDPDRGDYLGTPEQFAALYAVVARSIGLPARVVVGFRTPGPNRDGTYTVRAGDATAWPEVELDGVGWVGFDPDPGRSATASQKKAEPPGAQDPTDEVHSQPMPSQQHGAPHHRTHETTHPASGTAWWVWLLVAVGGVGLAGSAIVGLRMAAMRRRRARRRGDPDPARRMRGAWRDLLDRLRGHGIPLPASADASTLRDVATSRLPEPTARPVADFADLVNRTLFRRGGPTPDDAQQAWAYVDAYAAAHRRHTRSK